MDHVTSAARAIAAGGNPATRHSFDHPEHGPLEFTFRLPLATDSLRHSIEMDNLLQDLSPDVEPSRQTRIIAAAIAGMKVPEDEQAGKGLMLDLPVVSRTPDPDDDGKLVVRYYDASAELNIDFLIEVWLTFSAFRQGLLSDETVEAVGKSSATESPSTSSVASSTPSAAATTHPPATPAF